MHLNVLIFVLHPENPLRFITEKGVRCSQEILHKVDKHARNAGDSHELRVAIFQWTQLPFLFQSVSGSEKAAFLLSLIFTDYHKPEKSLKGNNQKQESKILKPEKIYMYKYVLPGQEFSTNMLKKKKKNLLVFPKLPSLKNSKYFGGGKSF